LRQQARRELLAESRKHTITAKLQQIPSLGPIRSALAVALIQTPHRFRKQVTMAKYERNMRHFVGWEEPQFSSPYGRHDIRTMFASMRHKYRVWKSFRDHTSHWPVFSIWFHLLSWLAVVGFAVSALVWIGERKGESRWVVFAVIACVLVLLGARDMGARLMRKLDWKRYGALPMTD
jgi:hypothetical protein